MADPTSAPCQFCFSYGLVQEHGVLVCTACGQQQQGFVEEGEDDGAAVQPGVRTLHLSRQPRATATVRTVAERELAAAGASPQGGVSDALRLYVPCLQKALSSQARVMAADYAVPEEPLRRALWGLWAAHLARAGALEPGTWRAAEQRIMVQEVVGSTAAAAGQAGEEKEEGAAGGGVGRRVARQRDLRKRVAAECHAVVSPPSLLVLLVMACHYTRAPATALDVLRAAAEGRMPYWDLAPSSSRSSSTSGTLPPTNGAADGRRRQTAGGGGGGGGGDGGGGGGAAWVGGVLGCCPLEALPGGRLLELALQPDSLPTLAEIMEMVAWESSSSSHASKASGGRGRGGIRPLGLPLPPVNVPLLLHRFAAELELPKALAAAACELYALRGGGAEFTFWHQSGTPPYSAVVALLVVALQVLYGLDGLPRRPPAGILAPTAFQEEEPGRGHRRRDKLMEEQVEGQEQMDHDGTQQQQDTEAEVNRRRGRRLQRQQQEQQEVEEERETEEQETEEEEEEERETEETEEEEETGEEDRDSAPPPPDWPSWAARQVSRVLRPSRFALSAAQVLQLPTLEWCAWLGHLRNSVFAHRRGPSELQDVLLLLQDLSAAAGSSSGAGGSAGYETHATAEISSGSSSTSGSDQSDGGAEEDDAQGGGRRPCKRGRLPGAAGHSPVPAGLDPGGGRGSAAAAASRAAAAAASAAAEVAAPASAVAAGTCTAERSGRHAGECPGAAPAIALGPGLMPAGQFVAWGATGDGVRGRSCIPLTPDAAHGMHPDYVAVLAAAAALVWASPLQVHQYVQLYEAAMEADERALQRIAMAGL